MNSPEDLETDGQNVEVQEKMHWRNWRVGVFGASSNQAHYAIENSHEVGRMLARLGMDAVNGGYAVGGMGSLAEGFKEVCREHGASDEEIARHLRGVIFSDKAGGTEIKKERGLISPAQYVEADTIPQRAGEIIGGADAYIATEGGPGTFLEVLQAAQNEWARARKTSNIPRPIIVVDRINIFAESVALWEKMQPGFMETIASKQVYALAGQSHFEDPLSPATLTNDEGMKKHLEMILEYYYLSGREQKTEEEAAQLNVLKEELFTEGSPFYTMNIQQRTAVRNNQPVV